MLAYIFYFVNLLNHLKKLGWRGIKKEELVRLSVVLGVVNDPWL